MRLVGQEGRRREAALQSGQRESESLPLDGEQDGERRAHGGGSGARAEVKGNEGCCHEGFQ